MNPRLALLQPYPFERLKRLLNGVEAPTEQSIIKMSVGEPQHKPPQIVVDALAAHLGLLSRYPASKGEASLREAQASWMQSRHGLSSIDSDTQILPVSGTREALFSIAQTCVSGDKTALVACPNPFYQIYEGAALLAGARTVLLDTPESQNYLPEPDALDDKQWDAMQLLYLCSPGNPAGAVLNRDLLQRFIDKAIRHDVVLVSDECYSEIYPDEEQPPTGLLAACEAMGLDDYRNCISMHSLSKRSNLPGLRSGFAAGDANILREFLRYRSYHGCAMPLHHQRASEIAWMDEEHVRSNRQLYRDKFAAVRQILSPVLSLNAPEGAFYFWPEVPLDDERFARELYRHSGVVVLPGSYLGRDGEAGNPGTGRVRMALVAELEDCVEAAERIATFVGTL